MSSIKEVKENINKKIKSGRSSRSSSSKDSSNSKSKSIFVQDFLEVPFALENLSSYVAFNDDCMNEWDFYGEIVEKADIYMMLDVNNIYVSSKNHGFNPKDYCNNIPLDRVLQIHLAGHQVRDGYLLDTHDNYVCDEVWQIYADVYPKTRGVSTLLEWDDNFLSFKDTWQEALKAKSYQNTLQQKAAVQ